MLSPKLAQLLGYAPRVDVLLEREDGGRRLWIEFEISRADPVANHARFATAQLSEPRPEGDVFLSMVSADVTRGRRNLAANTIWLMRHIGMEAYQTHLLPHTLLCAFQVLRVRFDSRHQAANDAAVWFDDDG